MDDSFTWPAGLRLALVGVGLFALGALVAFGYSYRPLHGAKSWQIAQLEERIDARNLENLKLADEVARLRSEVGGQVDPEAHAEVEQELERTLAALEQAQKDLERAERKRKDANASARRWRKRFETLRDETAVAAPAPAAPAPGPAPAGSLTEARTTGFGTPTASGPPDPGAGTIPTPGANDGPSTPAPSGTAPTPASPASPTAPRAGMLPGAERPDRP